MDWVRARGSFSNSSRRYQYGSHPFALAVSIKLYNSALAVAPRRRKLRVVEIADQLRPLCPKQTRSPCRVPSRAAT